MAGGVMAIYAIRSSHAFIFIQTKNDKSIDPIEEKIIKKIKKIKVSPPIYGFTLGGYNDSDNLKAKISDSSEQDKIRSIGNKIKRHSKVTPINSNCKNDNLSIVKKLLQFTKNYQDNTEKKPIPYPNPIDQLYQEHVNSNSWVRAICEKIGYIKIAKSDWAGWAIGARPVEGYDELGNYKKLLKYFDKNSESLEEVNKNNQ